MANSFKTLLPEDVATTRTLLHEAIPITGTIVSGTYTSDSNIKTFAHGMYEAVYDYAYLSSSANHIFDITCGYSPDSILSGTSGKVQQAKKINIYNQMAQVLVGYNVDGIIQRFDMDGNLSSVADKMNECFFVNFSRLLSKDEIKKDSFRMQLYSTASTPADSGVGRSGLTTIGDYGAQTDYKINSPAGEYGILYTDTGKLQIAGHVYYQAGIAVITASFFSGAFLDPALSEANLARQTNAPADDGDSSVMHSMTGTTITNMANAFRYTVNDISFNNTTELNSSIYFCRANNTEFNYSSNPTYLSASQVLVKGNNPLADPVSYVTTVGLFSPDNELLAVAKLSEPLKKSPSTELTLRVRLDY